MFAKKSSVFLGSRSLIRLGDCSAIFAPARYAHSRADSVPNAVVQTGSRSRPIRARTTAQIPIRTTAERPSNSPAHSHPRQWPRHTRKHPPIPIRSLRQLWQAQWHWPGPSHRQQNRPGPCRLRHRRAHLRGRNYRSCSSTLLRTPHPSKRQVHLHLTPSPIP